MKKVTVLGSNGYIARNLVNVLNNEYSDFELKLYGFEPTSFDSLDNYYQVDMTDRESVSNIDLNCDIIFMLVGKTGSVNSFDEYRSFIETNELTMLNLLAEYRRQNSQAKIIYPSTRLVYKGKSGILKEDSEKEFKTIYAINKFACEQYLEQFNRVYDVQYCIFRICIPYGTLVPGASSYGTTEFMLSNASKGNSISLYGDGSVRRTLTYIKDLCTVLIEGSISEKSSNNIFNIGGENYSLKEMAELIAEKYRVHVEYIPWSDTAKRIESGDTVFDSTKLDTLLGNLTMNRFIDWIT
jgi:UDP-glucose 4-epimerase